jgi:hypothetical protein
MTNFAFLPPLFLVGFVAFWCGVVRLLAHLGWQRLVPDFRVSYWEAGRSFGAGRASLGPVSYKGVITAEVTAAGLVLRALFLFRVGHPPLLIPWASLEPLRADSAWWGTTYETTIPPRDGGGVRLRFSNEQLFGAMQAAGCLTGAK